MSAVVLEGRFWHARNSLPQSIQLRLSVLVRYWGRLGRVKFILDVLRWKRKDQRTYTPIRPLPGDSAPLGAINTAVTRGGAGIRSRGEGGPVPQGPDPKKKKSKKPEGETPASEESTTQAVPWRTTLLDLIFKSDDPGT